MDILTIVITQPNGVEKDILSITRLEKAIDKVEESYKELHEVDFKIELRKPATSLEVHGYYKTKHEDGTVYEILESFID